MHTKCTMLRPHRAAALVMGKLKVQVKLSFSVCVLQALCARHNHHHRMSMLVLYHRLQSMCTHVRCGHSV
jgi:hypothetical protein